MNIKDLIQPKVEQQSRLTNYYQSFNKLNKSCNIISESLSSDKNINAFNISSYVNLEHKRKMNPIISNLRRKTETRKSLLNNMQNSFINNSVFQEKPKMISSFLHLEEFKKEIISPKKIIPKKIKIKKSISDINKSINIIKNKRYIFDKKIVPRTKSDFSFCDLGKNLFEHNKYLVDMMTNKKNENNETIEEKTMKEKKDWEDIKEKFNKNIEEYNNKKNIENNEKRIEQLAKDLNLFQNDKLFPIINMRKNSSFSNNNLLLSTLNISEVNNTTFNYNHNSKVSTRTQSPKNNSGKKINNLNKSIINKFNFDKNKIHDMLNKKESNINKISPKENKNEIKNLYSPLNDKSKDIFLFKKIFYFCEPKCKTKVKNKSFDNKLNLLYAENEKQFEEKISKQGKILNLGKTDLENKISDIKHKVKFMKKIFDYAFPDILIYRIKNKSKLNKSEIEEKNMSKIIKQNDLKEKLRNKLISKQNNLLKSIKIEKL